MKLIAFMNSWAGRLLRIVLGIIIFSIGFWVVRGPQGTMMSIMALIPLAGGIFDFCLMGLLMGYPVKGAAARQKLAGQGAGAHQHSCNPNMPYRIAALLALVIGGLAVVAGGRALIGKVPNYTILSWLPVYNYTMGFLAVLWAAPLLWTASKVARPVAIATFSTHAIVMVFLQTAFTGKVAAESLEAMWIRLIIWTIILALVYVPGRLQKMATI
jgi:hypothetical protein